MKRMLRVELRKMMQSRTLFWAILVGVCASMINVVENYFMTQRMYERMAAHGPTGYPALSIFHNWINGAQMTAGELVFFTIFPILAAIPFSWSLWNEKRNGYVNQILVRGMKRNYLIAKYISVFLSGGIAITAAMVFNFMANAWILPTCKTIPIIVGGGDGMFLSRLLFTKPFLYVFLCLVTSFLQAGTLACLALTMSFFFKNSIVTVLSPFVLLFCGSIISATVSRYNGEIRIMENLVTDPMQLLHAMTLDCNPAWYVWSILFGVFVLVATVYFFRGSKDEML